MNLACNMRQQAALVTELLDLAIEGYRRGAPYDQPPPAVITEQFANLLSDRGATELRRTPNAGAQLVELAAELHQVLVAPDLAQMAERLNALIARCRALPYLTVDSGQPYHLHFHGTAGTFVETLGGELATGLALVVDTLGEHRFGRCQASDCDRVYVDVTRNGARRYCSASCNARAKTAAYRTRQSGRQVVANG